MMTTSTTILSSLLLILLLATPIAAFTTTTTTTSTTTTTRISSSNNSGSSRYVDDQIINGIKLLRRQRQHQQLFRRPVALASNPSDYDEQQQQTASSLDVSSYMFPTISTTSTSSAESGGNDDDETKHYILQQTMIRIKDPIQSLDFYCKILGFRLIHYSEFPQWKFNVYFVAPVSALTSTTPTTPTTAAVVPNENSRAERWNLCMTTPGCIELTWNYGTEHEDGMVYNTGNADGTGVSIVSSTSSLSSLSSSSAGKIANDDSTGLKETTTTYKVRGGFGHIGITVPNVYDACSRFHSLGVQFHKSPNMGGMKGLAFIKDPDGYLIEVLPQGPMVVQDVDCLGVEAEGGDGVGYKDNSK